MRKELGKWLLDVAKYMVTALFLTRWFSGMEDWPGGLVWLSLLGVAFTLLIGLVLVGERQQGNHHKPLNKNLKRRK